MSGHVCDISATTLAKRVREGETSAVEVVESFLRRIDAKNDSLNAFVNLSADEALKSAHQADESLAEGDAVGPLHGVPVAIKDLFAFKKGVRNTFGSIPLSEFVPRRDAILVERLEAAGAIILGKTNTPELGHKGTTDNRLFGKTANPFDRSRTAGGSSGGSAAAVASGLAALGQGSDLAGSIRIPASACGLVGMKPSPGVVPHAFRPDAFSKHSPYLEVGPITRTVEDAALMLDVISGHHPADPSSLPAQDHNFRAATERPIEDLDIVYSPDLGSFSIHSTVRSTVEQAIDVLSETGASVTEVPLDFGNDWTTVNDAFRKQLQVGLASIIENLETLTGIDLLGDHRDDLEPKVVERAEAGYDLDGIEFKRADVVRTEVYDAMVELFAEHDVLLTPTLAVPPFKEAGGGWPFPSDIEGTEIDPRHGWFLTWPFNLTGHPAMSIPAGLTDELLPVGLQIIGGRFEDATVIATAAEFERVNPWYSMYQDAF